MVFIKYTVGGYLVSTSTFFVNIIQDTLHKLLIDLSHKHTVSESTYLQHL